MAEYINLVGAEDVGRAARQMADAAHTMQSAASTISHALDQHQRFLDDWLSRLVEAFSSQPSTGA